ncbi:MAG: DnaJ domain-containing protein [Desulfobacterales bacterium]|nr:MAG: DnaJ domain-containing protein [Desulfobacterales bacterium]
MLIILALLYALSPYDLFPDFYAIGWGWLDDLILLYLLWRYLNAVSKKQFNAKKFYQQFYGNQGSNHSSKKKTHHTGFEFEETDRPKDPYQVLNISKNASAEEIKTAYRQLANKYHPDKLLHLGEEFRKLAEQRFKEIEEAYRELKNK